MLDVSATTLPVAPGQAARPLEPVDTALLAELKAIEVAAGASKATAKLNAMAALGERDAALARIVFPEKPPMRDDELSERLNRLIAQLAALVVAAASNQEQPEGGWQLAAE